MKMEKPTSATIFAKATRTEEEAAYCLLVDELLNRAADEDISNGKPAHAVYLIYKFLTSATSSIRLFCGSLQQKLNGINAYSERHILNAAKEFLDKPDSDMRIILVDAIDSESASAHPLVKAAGNSVGGSFQIRQVPDPVKQELQTLEWDAHFLVMDVRAYRLETDPDEAKAVANFGDTGYAKALATFFDEIWSDCDEIWASA